MGACGHPTTDGPSGFHGFGSTLCYPTGGAWLCWLVEFRRISNTTVMIATGKIANKQNNIVFAAPKCERCNIIDAPADATETQVRIRFAAGECLLAFAASICVGIRTDVANVAQNVIRRNIFAAINLKLNSCPVASSTKSKLSIAIENALQ